MNCTKTRMAYLPLGVAESAQSVIRARGVSRCYALGHTKVKALTQVCIEITQGEMVVLWGPSGSGKSTLLNILGLIDLPDEGEVIFDGDVVQRQSDDVLSDYRKRKIGFVFQSFNLIPVLTALENVMLPLQLQGKTYVKARNIAAQWLDKVGLSAQMAARPDHLSGGQRQRAAIARALVINPLLVLADEPTANLDSDSSYAVMDLMHKMNREMGTTFVFSTHDKRLLDQIPRHIHLQDGRLISDVYKGVER